MSTSYDQALDDFAHDLARAYLRIFRSFDTISEPDRKALAEAITNRDKPAIRRILGGADARLERAIIEATNAAAARHLSAIADDAAARAALAGMVQSATKALVADLSAGLTFSIDTVSTRAIFEPWHLLTAIGLTDKQSNLYLATVRAAQRIADSIPRNVATVDAIRAAAQEAARNMPAAVARQLRPILDDPRNAALADATLRNFAAKLRKHHAGPAAHVAAHSLIEQARLQKVLRDIALGNLPTNTRKRWTNPLDERTRFSHAAASYANTSVPVGMSFLTPWGELDTPPPPGRDAYNCRCRAEYFTPSKLRTSSTHDRTANPRS